MSRRIVWALAGCVVLPGCLYVMAARVAISIISGAVSEVSRKEVAEEGKLPQERGALLEAYKNCLQQKSNNPTLDCSRYRSALGVE